MAKSRSPLGETQEMSPSQVFFTHGQISHKFRSGLEVDEAMFLPGLASEGHSNGKRQHGNRLPQPQQQPPVTHNPQPTTHNPQPTAHSPHPQPPATATPPTATAIQRRAERRQRYQQPQPPTAHGPRPTAHSHPPHTPQTTDHGQPQPYFFLFYQLNNR